MATIVVGSKIVPSDGMSYPGAIQSQKWQVIHADAEATAESAANLLRPTASGLNASVRYVKVPEGAVRCQLRAQYGSGATITTSPVLRVFGLVGSLSEAGVATEGDLSVFAQRLDATANTTGTTLTCDGTNDIRDGTYQWSQCLENQIDGSPWVDLQGCSYVTVLTETAASISTATAVQIVCKFLN